jgi:hypothetical protein
MTTTDQSFATAPALIDTLKKYSQTSAFVGLVLLLLLVAGYFLVGPEQFFRSYLIGLWFSFGAGMGCLGILMVQYLTGGAWGIIIRRPLEAGAKTLYVMVPLFLPILLFPQKLYFWASAAGASDKIVKLKSLYLNVPFLWVRFIIYAIVWLGVTTLLRKWGKLEEETHSMEYSNKLETLSAPGLVAFFFTVTFAGIDFLMSLDVTWASTIYGFLIIVGMALTALSIIVATLTLLVGFAPMDHAITKRHLHDLGKLMLAFVMLWAYLSFSQLLIIWSGNLPQEITWYTRRLNGGWYYVAWILALFHFVLPFSMLLSQSLKRNPRTIRWVAILIVVIHAVDVFWLVEPNFVDATHSTFTLPWLDVVSLLGFGGLWLALFFRSLPERALLPLGAPDLQKAMNHGRSH